MGESRPPPFVICHLCGRKYGTKSIVIHAPQCQKKWHAENQKLPKHLRRRLPSQPDYSILQSGTYNSEMVEQLNDMSFKASQAQLIPCENCGRTFYPEKLPVHQKSCTSSKPSRAIVHCKTSSSSRTTQDLLSSKNDIKKQTGETRRKSKIINSEGATILCAICMNQIPAERIPTHLVCCNEEKIQCIKNNSKDNSEVSPEITRPRTRTIRRAPKSDTDMTGNKYANDKDGTYDIIKPNSSYNIEKSVAIDKDLNNFSPCNLCNRKFTKDRINQHKLICSKLINKGRKTFDSSQQRMQGIEVCNLKKNGNKGQSNKPKSNWKQKHEEFIQSIRAAKQVTVHMAKGGKASDIPPPPPSLNPDYIYCKHCDRRFNPEVAERHIPKCATIMNRPAPPKKKALDVYSSQIQKKGLKKSETFSVRRSSADTLELITEDVRKLNGPLLHKKLSQQEKRRKPKPSGYVSPRVEKRYDSFEMSENNNNNVYRSMTSLCDYKASDCDNSSKDKYVKRNPSQKTNTEYSYNSVKRKPPSRKHSHFL